MPDQPLKDLLQRADQSASQAPLITTDPLEWAKHVQARKQRRDRVRTAAGCSSAIVFVLLISLVLTRSQPSLEPAQRFDVVVELPAAPPEASSATRMHWETEVAVSRLVARELLAARIQQFKTVAAGARVQSLTRNPIADALRLAEEASLIMVVQADRMDRELGLRRSSILAYRRTVELFPNSPYADVAKSRLDALQNQYNGGAL